VCEGFPHSKAAAPVQNAGTNLRRQVASYFQTSGFAPAVWCDRCRSHIYSVKVRNDHLKSAGYIFQHVLVNWELEQSRLDIFWSMKCPDSAI
jgi:hypothetical protein